MMRFLTLLLVSLFGTAALLPAQELTATQFRAEFQKGIDGKDDDTIERVIKRSPSAALRYYEELYHLKQKGDPAVGVKMVALQGGWKRAFQGSETVERVDRWFSGAENAVLESLQKCRSDSVSLWRVYNDELVKKPTREGYLELIEHYNQLAKNVARIGNLVELAEVWSMACVIAGRIPERTIDDRRAALVMVEEFLRARRDWGFIDDDVFVRNSEFAKAEKVRLEDDAKKADKRKAEGFGQNAKGIDALVVPGVAEVKHALKFEALANLDELDYGPKNGPVPAFWWIVSLKKEGSVQKFDWFKRRDLYMARTGAAKFAISLVSNELKDLVEVDVSPKGKISTFFLDAEKKQPYAMAFWIGSDREYVNEAQCNLTVSAEIANIYYRSAASWKTQVGADTVVLYDDNANGAPGDGDPYAVELKSGMLGQHDDKGTPVPLLDSMRVGKGPRQPYSEFVKLTTGWHYVQANADTFGMRPLHPDYVKTGKVKLVWNGPKPIAPVQLVIRGSGDFKSAFFDVASGKEVEVPAGDYTVVFGRVVVGKGVRAQMANIYRGDSEPFGVEAGKVREIKMGAPFTLNFQRDGDDPATIDALKILVKDAAGCVFGDWHGTSLACEVLASKDADGKGAKVVGKFVPFVDPELVNQAANAHNNLLLLTACFPMPDGYKTGPQVLKVDLPAAGMKLQLAIKKHPWFGALHSLWK